MIKPVFVSDRPQHSLACTHFGRSGSVSFQKQSDSDSTVFDSAARTIDIPAVSASDLEKVRRITEQSPAYSLSPVPFEDLPFNSDDVQLQRKNKLLNKGISRLLPGAWIVEKDVILPEKEPWTREGLTRYLAYVNEVGAALRELIKKRGVNISNWISGLYGVVDTIVVSKEEYEQSKSLPKNERNKRVAKVALDGAIFQVAASVIIPPWIILKVEKWSHDLMNYLEARNSRLIQSAPAPVKKWIPTAVSLASIPIIAPVLDRAMDFVMNKTIRSWLKMPPTHHRLHYDELHTAKFHQSPLPKNPPPQILVNHTKTFG